jgi:Flp pilus assembly protein TadD
MPASEATTAETSHSHAGGCEPGSDEDAGAQFSSIKKGRPLNQRASQVLAGTIRDALGRHQAGRLSEAELIYRQVLEVDPDNADCLHLLGMIAYQTGQLETAADLIGKAIAIHETAASYHSNLGNVLQAQGKPDEAGACYRRALALKPNQPEVHLNLGHILRARGETEASLACYRRALALNPDLPEARVAESMALLLKGDFAAGWHNFEWRWQAKDYDTPSRNYAQPLWNGEHLESGRLLIWGEQGIGDEIMFSGLVPDAVLCGNRCVLDCDARLNPLFARSFPHVDVISGYDPVRHSKLEISAHLPSGSLPGHFRTSAEAFSATRSPYLVADPVKRKNFRDRYDDGRRLVGLAWNTRNKKSGRARSIDLKSFAPLFSRTDIRWVSLQYGNHDTLESEAAGAGVPLIIDRTVNQFSDIDGFAAQVSAMDLVVSIDNSTAHLAGALGVPTWVLLPYAPDWRWLHERSDSPWYPAMRLFRQPSIGDWQSVLWQVETALDRAWNEPLEEIGICVRRDEYFDAEGI